MRWMILAATLAACGPSATNEQVSCGGHSCPSGTVCCLGFSSDTAVFTCAESCTGQVTVLCDGHCADGYCCDQHTDQPVPGQLSCQQTGTISCASECKSSQPSSGCGGSGTNRLCASALDCAGQTGFANCCSYPGEPFYYCVGDDTRASFINFAGSCK